MKIKIFSIIIIFFIAGLGWLYKSETTKKDDAVCFKDDCWQVEIADSEEEWARGLMFRENLDADAGMLFIFDEEGFYSFWMKNTKIPLDIIWLDANKRIVQINENTPPCEQENYPNYGGEQKAKYVLEIKAGEVEKKGIKIGDNLEMKIGK